jgi:hypothetical protein
VRTATVMVDGQPTFKCEVRCRRLRCGSCDHGWAVLPTQFVARKHYQAAVIARGVALRLRGESLAEVARLLSCSRRTVGRWVEWLASLRFEELGAAVRRLVGRVRRRLGETMGGNRVPALAR